MKKIAFVFAALAAGFGLWSCSVEPMAPVDENDTVTVLDAVFEGEDADTRTVRQSDGSLRWKPGDQISVFTSAGTGGGACFTSTNSNPVVRASFSGVVTAPGTGRSYYALYPYATSVSFDGSVFQVTLPDEQEAVANTFADDLFISIGRSTTTSMTFNHVTAGIKFTVTESDIKSVTLVGSDNEPIAGEVKVALGPDNKTPYVKSVVSGSHTVTLAAPAGQTLEVGAAYHIVTLPVTFENGFSLIFEKTDGSVAIKTVAKRVEIQRAHFGVLNEADKGLTWAKDYFEMSPYSFELTAKSQSFKLYISSSAEPAIEIFDNWVRLVEVEGDHRSGAYYVFRAERNRDEAPRNTFIQICTESNCYMATVSQEGYVEGDWMNADFVHHSLGMRFTATWCPHCPYMNTGFNNANEQLGGRLEIVNFHATNSAIPFAETPTLMNLYRATGYPTGIIDGRVDIPASHDIDAVANNTINAVKQQESTYPVVTGLEIDSFISGDKVTVNLNVYAKATDSYKVTVLLLENGIVGLQQFYDGPDQEDYVHNRTARVALTGITGDAFTMEEGEDKAFTFTGDIDETWNRDNLEVLVYVQRPFGSQTRIQSKDYGDYYVDNCLSAAVGTFAGLEIQ